ncbi:hypothetical protein [uncultured Winogradskyella sp.]|uniref:hypothetical protein n=1 Tax=Winogradskyella sp. 4-2091 TaxID=3381659 RepID=UPI00261CD369|nr:hypothetical protein [uncultured Winogradskyella sp.]
MKRSFFTICFVLFSVCFSCSKKEQEINLKWNKSYNEDTFDRSVTGLKWALAYLGSTITTDTTLLGLSYKDSIITLNLNQLGFSEHAKTELSKLQYIFKNSEAYKKNSALDLGRYIALTFGNSHHYYAITDVPKSLNQFLELYTLNNNKGYIDNSSVSKVDRIISFSNISDSNSQGFLSAEIDSISNDTLEYETVEIMPNGQLKFGIYDIDGALKEAGNSKITKAGKPAKCIWCHEVVIQPLFRKQQNHEGYLSYIKFNDTLKYFNRELQDFQDKQWNDPSITNKKLHTELELLYIAFMEPNAERISKEWNLPLADVKKKLAHLETHTHHEFPFLGNLYRRKDIDALAPIKYIEVPGSIREQSSNEVNLLN